MNSLAFPGLDLVARRLNDHADDIAYVTLQRADGRHDNTTLERMDFNEQSLRAFLPKAGLLLEIAPPQIAIGLKRARLADAMMAWLRSKMETETGTAASCTFKVNLWGAKGLVLHYAPRITVRRLSPLAAEVEAVVRHEAAKSGPPGDEELTEAFTSLMLASFTHGMAVVNERMHRYRGDHVEANRHAAIAEDALRLALVLAGYPESAAASPSSQGTVLAFQRALPGDAPDHPDTPAK